MFWIARAYMDAYETALGLGRKRWCPVETPGRRGARPPREERRVRGAAKTQVMKGSAQKQAYVPQSSRSSSRPVARDQEIPICRKGCNGIRVSGVSGMSGSSPKAARASCFPIIVDMATPRPL